MAENPIKPGVIAIVWDFGKTLAQNSIDPILIRFGISSGEFWEQVSYTGPSRSYLNYIVECVNSRVFAGLNNYQLHELGPDVVLYEGPPEFLEKVRTNTRRATNERVFVQHYVLSTDIEEVIKGSRIGPYSERVWRAGFTESITGPNLSPVISGVRMPEQELSSVLSELIGTVGGLLFIGGGRTDPGLFQMVRDRHAGPVLAVYDPREPNLADRVADFKAQRLVDEVGITSYTDGSSTAEWIIRAVSDIASKNFASQRGTGSSEQSREEFKTHATTAGSQEHGLINRTVKPANETAPILATRGTQPLFLEMCRSFLGSTCDGYEERLAKWHDNHLPLLESPALSGFMADFENSLSGTPRGRHQRRAAASENSDFEKLMFFLENLYRKYQGLCNN